MRWRHPYDYHGSRSYGAEEPVQRFRLILAWLASIAKGAFVRPPAEVVIFDGEGHFSVLGNSPDRPSTATANDPAPPQRSAAAINAHDFRIFP